VVLLILSFLILKPILLSIIMGVILAVVFFPLYLFVNKYIKVQSLSAGIICFLLILLIILPIWFFTPIFLEQAFSIYQVIQKTDFVTPLKSIFPSLFESGQVSNEIASISQSFITKTANSLVNSFSEVILNFPLVMMQLFIVFFTFFYVLRDSDRIIHYLQTLNPFPKDVEEKLFKSSREITFSVVYGQVLIGIVQGIIAGLGFFIFGINNAFLLTFLAMLAGILPIVGTIIVWFPVTVFLFIAGDNVPALGVAVFGIISSTVENILRPLLVSRMTRIHPLILVIGMIGGLFIFGLIGFILGPLVIAYLFIIIEAYRGKNINGVFIQPNNQ